MDDWRALTWFLTIALGVVLFLRITADGVALLERSLEVLRWREQRRKRDEQESEASKGPGNVADRKDAAA